MIDDVLHAILSTQGIVSALLFGALVYQSYHLERARDYRDKTDRQIMEEQKAESLRRLEAFTQVALALTEMKGLLRQLVERNR